MFKKKSHIPDLTQSIIEFSESHQTSIEYLTQFDEFLNSFFACTLKLNARSKKVKASSLEFVSNIKVQANCIEVLSFSLEVEKNPSSSISLCELSNRISGENKSRHFVRICEYEFYLQVINKGIFICDIFNLSTAGNSRYSDTFNSVDRLLEGLEQFKNSVRDLYDSIYISPIVVSCLGADAIDTFPAISSEKFINLYDK